MPIYLSVLLVVLIISFVAFAIRVGTQIFSQITKLSFQNKLLLALRHLDHAAISIMEIEPICQEIVNVIRKELGYFFGGIALLDHEAGILRRVALSSDPELNALLRKLPIEYKKQIVPLIKTDNLFIKVLKERKSFYTTNLHDIQIGIFTPEISAKVQEVLKLKGLFVHPLLGKSGVIGVIWYATLIEKEKLSKFEFEVMDEYTREASRFLENVYLYQDLKDLSQKLKAANTRLQELDQLKDEFVSVASHELRTPMTAIRSYAWMALNRSDVPLSKTLQKYVVRILMSTERLINMVNDMLNVSRIESGRIEINPESVDILSLVKDIIDEVYFSKFEEKHIEFVVLEQPIPKVFADPGKLRQVLLNLVGNSMKFTPDGGKITFSFFSDGNTVDISVIDTGVGITKEDISKLFRKFSRLDNSYVAAATSGGTGLGLYISKSLLDLMHGKISVSSEGVGRGTTFKVTLPAASQEVLANVEKYKIKAVGQAKQLEPVAL